MNLKLLLEKRAELGKEIARLNALNSTEGRAWTAEDESAWVKVNADYDENQRKIAMAERAAAVEKQLNTRQEQTPGREDRTGDPSGGTPPGENREITDEHRTLALNAWCRAQYHVEPSEQEAEACRLLRFNPHRGELIFQPLPDQARASLQRQFLNTHPSRQHDIQIEPRAMTTFAGATGGYLIPPVNFIRNLEINMLAFGGMMQVAEIINTSTGERMQWPTADDTSNTGAQLGESTTIGSSVDPAFASVFWDAYKFSSKPVLVPYELIQDSAFDIAGMLGAMLGERLGRISNTKFTTATGAATPKGITNCSALGVTSATATVITMDEVVGLVHSVDPAYRNGARFMFHDGILLYLRKLKDGEGRYLWQQGVGVAPDSLWGYPYTINQDMQSTVATATKTILFGQLSKYKIRQVGGTRLYRLQERYRDTDQDGFVAFQRQDGNLLTAGTAPVKHLLQA